MTLVIAKKTGNIISFSSDSRASFSPTEFIDFGIKIFSVPVRIYSPTDSKTLEKNLDFNFKLGLAVIGSTINANLVKESIYEILQNLQYLPGSTDISMDSISKLVFKIFKKVTLDYTAIMREKGRSEIILGGFCPDQNKVRVFKFSTKLHPDKIEPYYDEILLTDGIEFFGSGESEARIIFQKNSKLEPLNIIKEVINGKKITSVGGGLQHGEFIDNNFNIFGVIENELNPDGTLIKYLFTLRGINMYQDDFNRDNDDFHIIYEFKRPFEKEIKWI